MKKCCSQNDVERTEEEIKEMKKAESAPLKLKNNAMFWALIAVVLILVIFFTVRYFTQPDEVNPFELPEGEEELYYNNFRFVKIDGMWYTQWQKEEKLYTVPFRFNPYEAEKVPSEGKLDVELFNKMPEIFITFDLSDEENSNFSLMALATTELSQNLVKAINRRPIAACINNESSACEDRPIITCDNNDVPVIFVREQSPTKVILEDNCMILQGEGMDLLKAVDKVLYQWYGIIV